MADFRKAIQAQTEQLLSGLRSHGQLLTTAPITISCQNQKVPGTAFARKFPLLVSTNDDTCESIKISVPHAYMDGAPSVSGIAMYQFPRLVSWRLKKVRAHFGPEARLLSGVTVCNMWACNPISAQFYHNLADMLGDRSTSQILTNSGVMEDGEVLLSDVFDKGTDFSSESAWWQFAIQYSTLRVETDGTSNTWPIDYLPTIITDLAFDIYSK